MVVGTFPNDALYIVIKYARDMDISVLYLQVASYLPVATREYKSSSSYSRL